MKRHRPKSAVPSAPPVRILRDRIGWATAPAWAREALERVAGTVADIRRDLASEAPHRWMPTVDIVPRAWVRGPSTVDGNALIVERDGRHAPGVELPAQLIAYDGPWLRGLLVHEFSHCFEMLEHIFAHAEAAGAGAGARLPTLRFSEAHDDEADNAKHVAPADWFGPSVTSVPKRGELPLYDLSAPFLDRWAEAGLPIDEKPHEPYRIDAHLSIERAVVLHFIDLKKRRAGV